MKKKKKKEEEDGEEDGEEEERRRDEKGRKLIAQAGEKSFNKSEKVRRAL